MLRRVRMDEGTAGEYPHHLTVAGIVALADAGVEPVEVAAASPVLTAAGILAFRAHGHAYDDADYSDRFFDASLLADEGVPASVANAYPGRFSEVDVARFHNAGATPERVADYPDDWSPNDIADLVGGGVTAAQAMTWYDVPGVPPAAIAACVESGAEPATVARFIDVVGQAVRAPERTLVTMALDSARIDEPEAVRSDLLTLAIRSIEASDEDQEQKTKIAAVLEQIVARGGELSTSIPDSWNRSRVLHVGPEGSARATLAISPDQPLRFNDGEIDLVDGVREVNDYCAALPG